MADLTDLRIDASHDLRQEFIDQFVAKQNPIPWKRPPTA